MYVCMYVCMYVQRPLRYMYIYLEGHWNVYVRVLARVCMLVYVHACLCVLPTYARSHACVCRSVRRYVRMYDLAMTISLS